ncbi:MAG: DNA helicase RecG, partial [Acidimicrobiales bacterium]
MSRRLSQLAEIPVSVLAGVGAKKAEALAAMDIRTILDLLTHYPRRYLDRTRQAAIRELKVGQEALVLAKVKRVQTRRTRQRRAMVEVDVFDGSSYLHCVFFNQPWRARQLKIGTEAVFFGRLDSFKGRPQMTNPVVDLVGDRTGRIVPIYPQSEKAGLTTWELSTMVEEGLVRAGELADPLPRHWQDRLDVVDRTWAMTQIHNPESMGAAEVARRRLVLDELLRLQTALVMRKRAVEREAKGIRHTVHGGLVERFHSTLPFTLTSAQQRAVAEIAADLAGPHPMHRLLQGDVGSGKTLVAVTALLMAVQGSYQGAFMAPTEVLAEQHGLGMRDLLEGFTVDRRGALPPDGPPNGDSDAATLSGDRPLRVELLVNRTTAGERTRILAGLADGSVDLLIGTHALLEEKVAFGSLGVVVIDEQHRFG